MSSKEKLRLFFTLQYSEWLLIVSIFAMAWDFIGIFWTCLCLSMCSVSLKKGIDFHREEQHHKMMEKQGEQIKQAIWGMALNAKNDKISN